MIEAKIIEDSISPTRARLTTFQLRYPRFIHCFDEETEYLSQIYNEIPRFRSFEAIKTLQCKIAQYDSDSEIINFIHPLAIHENQFSGTMVSFEKKKFSLNVTDGHRIFTLRRTTNNQFVPNVSLAQDFLKNYPAAHRIPQAGHLDELSRTYNKPNEAALIAWYIADGHLTPGRKVQFHFRKQRKIDAVVKLLDILSVDFVIRQYGQDTILEFDPPYWVDDCYADDGSKQYPNLLLGMTELAFAAFQKATLESDGNVENQEINTTSLNIAEQTQVLALLNNVAMNIRRYDGGLYKQKYQETPYISLRSDKDQFQSTQVEDKPVYCFTTNTSYLVVRRNGIPYISGNCELMTHRLFSRNASSSRAIPAKRLLDDIENEPAMPVHWGLNEKGMQARNEMDAFQSRACEELWLQARDSVLAIARSLESMGLHKQVVNRITEPWAHISVVCTATEWDNFFSLRCHPDAQPEIKCLAEKMRDLYFSNVPRRLNPGQWHLPYILDEERFAPGSYGKRGELKNEGNLIKASVARCARVSYLTHDKKKPDLDLDLTLHDRLWTSRHLSPFEHVATPHVDPHTWSGNFKGWIQYRKTIKGEFGNPYQPPQNE